MVRLYTKYLMVASITNCLYLSYVNLRGFLLEQELAELSRAFTFTIFATPFILLVFFSVSLVKKDNFFKLGSNRILLLLCSVAITIMFGIFLYSALKDNIYDWITQVASILFEIFSILFAIKKNKDKRIIELLSYFSLCFLTGILSYSIIGFLERYWHYPTLDSQLKFIFAAIFLHFLNACFISFNWLTRRSQDSN